MNFLESQALYWATKMMRNSLKNALVLKDTDKNITHAPKPNRNYMLYIHVPFCHTFCPYCSFHKFIYNEDKVKKYFLSVKEELLNVKKLGFDFETLYIGGGTTLIDEEELANTIEFAKSLFNIKEVSCESDPTHIIPEKLIKMKGLIDRLSVGVQSFDDGILRKIGRYEKFGSGEQTAQRLKDIAGILPTISIDLIFNFPNQTKEMLLRDIEIATSLGVGQITTYPLMNSNLTQNSLTKIFGKELNKNEREFYELINANMGEYKPLNSWAYAKGDAQMSDEYVGEFSEYVGVGSGAFSFLNGELFVNAYNLEVHDKMVREGKRPIVSTCSFSKKDILQYQFMTNLFNGPIDIKSFNAIFEDDIQKVLKFELLMLKIAGGIVIEDGKIVPTEFGKYLCLVLMKEFYSGMDRVRAMFKE